MLFSTLMAGGFSLLLVSTTDAVAQGLAASTADSTPPVALVQRAPAPSADSPADTKAQR